MIMTSDIQNFMIEAGIITSEKTFPQAWRDVERYFTQGPVKKDEIPQKLEQIKNVLKELGQAYNREKTKGPEGDEGKQGSVKDLKNKLKSILSKLKGPFSMALFTALTAAAQDGKYDFEKPLIQLLEEQGADSAYIAGIKEINADLEKTFEMMDKANIDLKAIQSPDTLLEKPPPTPRPKQKGRGGQNMNVNRIAEEVILDSIMVKDADKTPDLTGDVTEQEVIAYGKRLKDRFGKIEKQVEAITKKDGKIDTMMKGKNFNKVAEALVNFEAGWEEGFKTFKV